MSRRGRWNGDGSFYKGNDVRMWTREEEPVGSHLSKLYSIVINNNSSSNSNILVCVYIYTCIF
jgi:hypothetical protein